MSPSTFTDGELWQEVWQYLMISENGDTVPSDAAKFEYLVRRLPMVAVQLSKRDRHTEYKPACQIPKDSIIVFYYQHNSQQEIFPTVQQARYRILGQPQPMGNRTMQRIDTNPHPYAPLTGTVSWDTSLHVEPTNISVIFNHQPLAIKESDTAPIKRDPVTSGRDKFKKSLQVGDLYSRMSCLHVISENAVGAGNLNVLNVVLALVEGTIFIAQVTLHECQVMLEKGLSSLDYPLWYPMRAHGDISNVKKQAWELLQPTPGEMSSHQYGTNLHLRGATYMPLCNA